MFEWDGEDDRSEGLESTVELRGVSLVDICIVAIYSVPLFKILVFLVFTGVFSIKIVFKLIFQLPVSAFIKNLMLYLRP